ncbi:MAG: 3'(2'),5'-bisphosphate nucleotidase CysQ [Candidatus Sericytochromatia bacterium]|nr:3'(2'),5'-bisphosphate nucleotidase CysQ [Candidatus Sericytochromatia bacterium]
MEAFSEELRVASALATAAGRLAFSMRRPGLLVDRKAANEPVTAADRAASDLIMAGLQTAFPDDIPISEEAPDDRRRLDPARRVWFIDPIDGTQDFIDGGPGFASMIGLCVGGRPRLGAVYQPTTDRLYYGGPGLGAWVTEAGTTWPIHCADTHEITAMRLVASKSHPSKRVAAIKAAMGITQEHTVGSVGVKVALIASGEQDLYVSASTRTKAWDTCGPEAIILAAGGRFTNIWGKPLQYADDSLNHTDGLMASNGPLHDMIVDRLRHLLPAHL